MARHNQNAFPHIEYQKDWSHPASILFSSLTKKVTEKYASRPCFLMSVLVFLCFRKARLADHLARGGIYHTKKDFLISEEAFVSVGVPGLEPGKAGPESAVLPLHHTPICCATDSPLNRSRRCNFCFACAKVLLFFELPSIFLTFFIKKTKIRIFLLVIRQKGIIFAGNKVSIRCSSDKNRSSYSIEQKNRQQY